MRVVALGDFAAHPAGPQSGSQVRSHQIADELEKAGCTVNRAPRDLIARSRTALAQLAALPRAIARADALCLIGIPHRSLAYRIAASVPLRRRPIVLDFNDDPIMQYECLMNREHPKAERYARLTRLFVQRSSAIAFLTESMRSHYLAAWSEHGDLPSIDTIIVPNASDPNHFHGTPIPENLSVAYLGGIAPGRGLDILFEAVALLQRTIGPVELQIGTTGQDSNHPSLSARVTGATFVRVKTGVDYAAAPAFLDAARICVIPHLRKEYLDFILPIKLFDYMAAGRPIVASDNTETEKVLLASGAGLVSPPEPETFAAQIGLLLEDYGKCVELGTAGRRSTVSEHNWASAVRPLADCLSTLA